MAKALTGLGAVTIAAIVVAYPVGAVIALVVPLAVVLGIVWWLTDSPVAVSRARSRTWFDRAASASVGGWHDADEVAASRAPADEPHTAEVVMKGARRADHRRA